MRSISPRRAGVVELSSNFWFFAKYGRASPRGSRFRRNAPPGVFWADNFGGGLRLAPRGPEQIDLGECTHLVIQCQVITPPNVQFVHFLRSGNNLQSFLRRSKGDVAEKSKTPALTVVKGGDRGHASEASGTHLVAIVVANTATQHDTDCYTTSSSDEFVHYNFRELDV